MVSPVNSALITAAYFALCQSFLLYLQIHESRTGRWWFRPSTPPSSQPGTSPYVNHSYSTYRSTNHGLAADGIARQLRPHHSRVLRPMSIILTLLTDPRITDWPLMVSPVNSALITAGYFALCQSFLLYLQIHESRTGRWWYRPSTPPSSQLRTSPSS